MIKKILILIVEKYTNYEIIQKKNIIYKIKDKRLKEIIISHENHKETVKELKNHLDKLKLRYKLIKDDKINNIKNTLEQYTHIISLGGDGTFLHSSAYATSQILIGINTDPKNSIGRLTNFTKKDIIKITNDISNSTTKIKLIPRLSAKINDNEINFNALNEIIVGSELIYKTTHLLLTINNKQSNIISNGIVISTNVGSTAFYSSSGAQPFNIETLGYSLILPYKNSKNLPDYKILEKDEKIKISTKRNNYILIFDCDEKRKIKLEQEDKIEIYLNYNKSLITMI